MYKQELIRSRGGHTINNPRVYDSRGGYFIEIGLRQPDFWSLALLETRFNMISALIFKGKVNAHL